MRTQSNTIRNRAPGQPAVAPVDDRPAVPAAGLWTNLGVLLQGVTAAAVLLSADVHLDLWAEGFRQVRIVGPLFLLNAAGGLVIALALLLWRHWLPALAAFGFGAATLGAYWISVTVGLFGMKETTAGVPQLVSEISEIVIVVGAVLLLVIRWIRPDR